LLDSIITAITGAHPIPNNFMERK